MSGFSFGSNDLSRTIALANSNEVILDGIVTKKTDVIQSEVTENFNTLETNITNEIELLSTNINNEMDTLSTNIESEIVTLRATVGNGSPKGVFATLSALQAAYPTGTTGIYVVTADGKWYYWNGSSWTAGNQYQAISLGDKSIIRTNAATSFGGMQDGMYFNNMDYKITREGTSIKVKFAPSSIGYYKNIERRDRIELGSSYLEYTIPHNSSLVYSIGTYDRFLVKATDELTNIDYILLNSHNGSDKINKLKEFKAPFNDILYAGGDFIYEVNGTDIVVTWSGSLKRTFVKSGYRSNDRYMAGSSNIVYTVPTNHALVYNIFSNEIVVRQWDGLNIDDTVLLGNYSGKVVQNNIGAKGKVDDVNIYNPAYVVNSKESSVRTGLNVGQGITIINEYLLLFDESLDDHSAQGDLHIYNKNTFAFIKTVKHNLGHCNTVDYNPRNNKLLISNCPAAGVNILPELYIINDPINELINAPNNTIDFFTANITVIKLHNGTTDIGGFGQLAQVNACWGEKDNLVYAVMNRGKAWYRLFLGQGTGDVSTKPNGGGFYEAAAEGLYNGTFRVLGIYQAVHVNGVIQDMKYGDDGKFYVAETHGQLLVTVYDLLSNGLVRMVNSYDNTIRGHLGDIITYEPEGVTIDNGKLYQGFRGSSKGVVITQLD